MRRTQRVCKYLSLAPNEKLVDAFNSTKNKSELKAKLGQLIEFMRANKDIPAPVHHFDISSPQSFFDVLCSFEENDLRDFLALTELRPHKRALYSKFIQLFDFSAPLTFQYHSRCHSSIPRPIPTHLETTKVYGNQYIQYSPKTDMTDSEKRLLAILKNNQVQELEEALAALPNPPAETLLYDPEYALNATPIGYAAYYDAMDCLEYLNTHCKPIRTEFRQFMNEWDCVAAVNAGNIKAIDFLLNAPGIENSQKPRADSFINAAIWYHRNDILEHLLEAYPDDLPYGFSEEGMGGPNTSEGAVTAEAVSSQNYHAVEILTAKYDCLKEIPLFIGTDLMAIFTYINGICPSVLFDREYSIQNYKWFFDHCLIFPSVLPNFVKDIRVFKMALEAGCKTHSRLLYYALTPSRFNDFKPYIDEKVMRYILENHLPIDANMLQIAIQNNSIEALRPIVENCGLLVGNCFAWAGGDLAVAQYLLNNGAPIQQEAVNNALDRFNIECLDFLLSQGLTLPPKIKLRIKQEFESSKIARMVVYLVKERGVSMDDIELVNSFYEVPFVTPITYYYYALEESSSIEAAQIFVENGIMPSPLPKFNLILFQNDSMKVIRLLLEKFPEIDLNGEYNNETIMMCLVKSMQYRKLSELRAVIKDLVKSGADINYRTASGITVLSATHHPEVLELLRSEGAI